MKAYVFFCIIFAFVFCLASPIDAQNDLCTPLGAVSSYRDAISAQIDPQQWWNETYAGSGCSESIKAFARTLADAYSIFLEDSYLEDPSDEVVPQLEMYPSVAYSIPIALHGYFDGEREDNDGDPFPGARGSYAISDDQIFVEAPEGNVQAYELSSGSRLWTSNASGMVLGADSEYVYVAPSSQRIEALDIATGVQKWRTLLEVPNAIIAGRFVIADDVMFVSIGSRFSGYSGRYLAAIDKTNGTILAWYPGNILGQRENVVLINYWLGEGQLIAGLSPETLQAGWELDTSDFSEIADCDGLLVYVQRFRDQQSGSVLVALDAVSGRQLWSTEIFPQGIGSARCSNPNIELKGLNTPPTPQSVNLYIAGLQESPNPNHLVALDPQTGEIRWNGNEITTVRGTYEYIQAYNFLGEIGSIVLYSHEGYGLTQAYDVTTHNLNWENSFVVVSQLYGSSGGILVGEIADSRDYRMYVGLDSVTGDERWRQEVEKYSYTSPQLVSGYLIDREYGGLRVYDPLTGQQIASLAMAGTNDFYESVGEHRFLVFSTLDDNTGSISLVQP